MLSIGNFLGGLINPVDSLIDPKTTDTNTSTTDFKDILYSLIQPQKQTKDKILTDIDKIFQDILGFFQNISYTFSNNKSPKLDEKVDLTTLNNKSKTSIINILKDIENLSKDINPNFDGKSIESIIQDIKTPKPNESIIISISIQEEISIGKDSKFLDNILSNLDQYIFSKKEISAHIASFSFEIISQTSNTSKPLFSLKAQKLPNDTLKDLSQPKISMNIDIPKDEEEVKIPLSEDSKQNIDPSTKAINDNTKQATTLINLKDNKDTNKGTYIPKETQKTFLKDASAQASTQANLKSVNLDDETTSYKSYKDPEPINTDIHQTTSDKISEYYALTKGQQIHIETSNKDNETSHKITYLSKDIELNIEFPGQNQQQKDIKDKNSKDITTNTRYISIYNKEDEYNTISDITKGDTSKTNSDKNQGSIATKNLNLDDTEYTKDINNNREYIQKNNSTIEAPQNTLKSNKINQDIKSFETKDNNIQNKIIDDETVSTDKSSQNITVNNTKNNENQKVSQNPGDASLQYRVNDAKNNENQKEELAQQTNITENAPISKNPLQSDNSNNILETPTLQDKPRENSTKYTDNIKEDVSTMTKNIIKDTNLDTTQYQENHIKNQEQDIKQYIEKNINAINLENKDIMPKTSLNNIHDFANPIKDMIKDVASLQAFNTNTSDKQKDNKDNNQGFNMNYQQNMQNTQPNTTNTINTDKVFKEIEKTVLKEAKNPVLMKNVSINLDDGTTLQIKFNANNLSIAINTDTELVYKDYQIKDLVKNLQSLGFSIENITINGATIESQMGFSENKDQKKDEKEQKENYQTDQSFELVNAV